MISPSSRIAAVGLVALAALLSTARAADTSSALLLLDSASFDSQVTDETSTLVAFVAPWCGHCKHLKPTWAELADKLAAEHPEIKVAQVDATQSKELATRFGIRGFPTVKFFKNGEVYNYKGSRTVDAFTQFALEGFEQAGSQGSLPGPLGVAGAVFSQLTEYFDHFTTIVKRSPDVSLLLFAFGLLAGVLMAVCFLDTVAAAPSPKKTA